MKSEKRRAKRIRRTLELYKLYDNKCQRCGYESYYVGFFDFHHSVPDEKEANVGRLICTASWDRILKEAEKCMMLCPTCHRLEHLEMRIETDIERDYDGRPDYTVGE